MESYRILSVILLLLLSVCLICSVASLTVLRRTVKEADSIRSEAESLLEELKKPTEEPVESDTDQDSIAVDVLCQSFCMRENGGKIAIYTADGELVRILDLAVDTLPERDRIALQNGISLSSWKEVLALIEDYGG